MTDQPPERMIPEQTLEQAITKIRSYMPPDNAGDLATCLAWALTGLGLINVSDPPPNTQPPPP